MFSVWRGVSFLGGIFVAIVYVCVYGFKEESWVFFCKAISELCFLVYIFLKKNPVLILPQY